MLNKFRNKNELTNEFMPYLDFMDDSNIKKYILNRVINQINWYDKKSIHFQRQFKWMSVLSIILSASIPIFTTVNLEKHFIIKIIVVIISALVTIITSILSLCKYRELWVEYRNCCETLKSLLYKFFNNSDPFSSKDDNTRNSLLILSCETILNSEVNKWICSNNEKNIEAYGSSIDS